MNTYLIVKTLHIISASLLVGTGFGSAFYLFAIHRTKNIQAIAQVSQLVCLADWCFTTPAGIFQPLSGFWMMHHTGMTFSIKWLAWALGLYIFAGLCWLPVVWLQLRLSKEAAQAAADGAAELPKAYWQKARLWECLGYPAFLAMAAVYFLMVLKPS